MKIQAYLAFTDLLPGCSFLMLASRVKLSAAPQQRRAAEAGLNLAIRLGLPPAAFLDALLDPARGQMFYELFRPAVHSWVLWNATPCCAALVPALGEGGCAALPDTSSSSNVSVRTRLGPSHMTLPR